MKDVYIISDLHLGGTYGDANEPPFRMCTQVDKLAGFVEALARRGNSSPVELVINGDFVDFLAEPYGDGWTAFREYASEARSALKAIIDRDRAFFDALRDFVRAKNRLVILLGNHDIELSFPLVRSHLLEEIGATEPSCVSFLYDGEAYVVGDALIEHGNRYDGFNAVDHDGLRRHRSLLSRSQALGDSEPFRVPPGSKLVAEIMNDLKKDYPFVDLLKPEVEATIPLLLTMAPQKWSDVLKIVAYKAEAVMHDPKRPGVPRYASEMAAFGEPERTGWGHSGARGEKELREAVGVLGSDGASFVEEFLDTAESGAEDTTEMASLGQLRSLAAIGRKRERAETPEEKAAILQKAVPILSKAFRVLCFDRSFDESHEGATAYRQAAEALTESGLYRYVVFGHTHLKKRVGLNTGATYLNTGTWANIMRVPDELIVNPLTPQQTAARDERLGAFLSALASTPDADASGGWQPAWSEWIEKHRTYVRLGIGADGKVDPERVLLGEFGGGPLE